MMGVSESKLHLHLHLPLFIFVIVFSFDNALCIRFPDRVHPSDHHHQRFNTAVFALGSFWRSEAVFGCLPGVIRTTVGYAGGSKHNPRYRTFGDHAESVQVQYDPGMTSFKELLDIFWSCHDPRQVYGQGPDVGNQYRSIIFVNGTEESRIASVSKEQEQARSRSSIVTTQILQLGTFYPAEPEHQLRDEEDDVFNGGSLGTEYQYANRGILKFELKKNSFLIKLIGNLHEEELERSSLATKLNGYVAELCPPNIQKHIDAKINEIVKKGWPILREL
ncbi:hypothetical protein Lal_00012186 [Lupinus albus]|nr:hypothetical protein Lal_00012186 [Lupinus albus]